LANTLKIEYYVFSGHTKTLDQFEYTDSDINDMVYGCLGTVSFQGAGKQYSFSTDGEIQDDVVVERIQSRGLNS